jgi:Family of unknown function (DUF6093)
MSRASVVARGRTFAEAGMVDACVIRRRTGESTGPGGVITPTWSTLYTGRCRVQIPDNAAGSGDTVGEAYLVVERRHIQLPMSVTGLAEGDRLTITSAGHDADLVGKVYALRDIPAKTDATARRVTGLEVTS